MAKRRASKKYAKNNVLRPILGILASLFTVALVVAAVNDAFVFPNAFIGQTAPAVTATPSAAPAATTKAARAGSETNAPPLADAALELHVINVGDGDCLLLRADGHDMLIDAGHDGDFAIVDAYLEKVGAAAFDFALATHPHEDHIGSMDMFVKKYRPERMLVSPRAHTTKHYENLLDALIDTGLRPETPIPGDTYALGGAVITVLAPLRDDYEEINDSSVVVRVDYGSVSLLLTGDAEKPSEDDMLASGRDLSVTVLKLGHHGSKTSTSKAFLSAVAPDVAVASAKKDVAVAQRLADAGVPFYSTSDCGSIVVRSDGTSVTLEADRLPAPISIMHK